MRTARIVEEGEGYYHIMSRVVDRQMLFTFDENERFRKTMRAVAGFCGVDILTYAAMTTHFHLLLHIPAPQVIKDDEFGRRLKFLYDETMVDTLLEALAKLRAAGQDQAAEALKEEYTYRMHDLGEFTKTLKQRVTMSYNKRHGRKGTLWEERYKSVLIEGSPVALSATAAYIDLNAVRAGMVKDPKDYRFCGYGEAMGGSQEARRGVEWVTGVEGDWAVASARYRQLLYSSGEARGVGPEGQPMKRGFTAEEIEAVLAGKGKLTLSELLRCRVRYFADGAILGSRAFVEEAFGRHREHFGAKRQTCARPMRGGEWGDLAVARALQVSVFGRPAPA